MWISRDVRVLLCVRSFQYSLTVFSIFPHHHPAAPMESSSITVTPRMSIITLPAPYAFCIYRCWLQDGAVLSPVAPYLAPLLDHLHESPQSLVLIVGLGPLLGLALLLCFRFGAGGKVCGGETWWEAVEMGDTTSLWKGVRLYNEGAMLNQAGCGKDPMYAACKP